MKDEGGGVKFHQNEGFAGLSGVGELQMSFGGIWEILWCINCGVVKTSKIVV